MWTVLPDCCHQLAGGKKIVNEMGRHYVHVIMEGWTFRGKTWPLVCQLKYHMKCQMWHLLIKTRSLGTELILAHLTGQDLMTVTTELALVWHSKMMNVKHARKMCYCKIWECVQNLSSLFCNCGATCWSEASDTYKKTRQWRLKLGDHFWFCLESTHRAEVRQTTHTRRREKTCSFFFHFPVFSSPLANTSGETKRYLCLTNSLSWEQSEITQI